MADDITAGALRERVRAACAGALAAGALGPIDTREERFAERGVEFRLRTVAGLARKEAAAARAGGVPGDDPFAPPYEPELHVGAVPPAHVGLLNKYPVLDTHLLVVTREWAPQDGALDRADCEALLRVLAAGDGLAFYNGGETAGASQPHRHLQWVGLGERPPLEAPVAAGDALPFPCAAEPMPAEWLEDPVQGAEALLACYGRLLAAIGRAPGGRVPAEPEPYNLAATRDTIWAVPRRAGHSGPVAVNGLGYAGYMLAADDEQAAHIRRRGPFALLADAADH